MGRHVAALTVAHDARNRPLASLASVRPDDADGLPRHVSSQTPMRDEIGTHVLLEVTAATGNTSTAFRREAGSSSHSTNTIGQPSSWSAL